MTASAARHALVTIEGLTKAFDGVEVLSDADLTVREGEIHALVGANGSGKSTLIKILSGYHTPTAGRITRASDQSSGLPLPIAFVHQDLGLVETMSVQENIALSCGFPTGRGSRVRWDRVRSDSSALLEEFGVQVDPTQPVQDLGGTERRLVAIARASHSLGGRLGLLVLDEPTASLPPDEVHLVFALMRAIAATGSGVLFVCHDLHETLAVADQVTVLRNGRVVQAGPSADATVQSLARAMFGTSINPIVASANSGSETAHAIEAVAQVAGPPEEAVEARADHPIGTAAQDLRDTNGPGLRLRGLAGNRIGGIDLAVGKGEIVGITGLVGSGKSELGRLVAGAQLPTAGAINVGDGPWERFRTPHAALARGVAYVPPDRRRSGGVLPMRATENVTLSTIRNFVKRGRIDRRAEAQSVAAQMRELGVVPLRPEQEFAAFSGGNQQKLVFGRVLRLDPKVVVLDDPTQGVDAETIPELYRFIRMLAGRGCAVLVISADLDELVEVAERVVVLRDGRIADELAGRDVTVDRIGTAVAAAGGKERPA